MTTERRFCTFYLDGLFFGIPVERVQEVIRHQELTRVPGADETVSGLMNLRGQIVTAINLRRRLRLSDRAGADKPVNVVVQTEEGPVSLLVDRIGDVLEVEDESFERAPETLQGEARDLIRGAYKLERTLLLILDTEKAISATAAAS